MEQNKPGSVEMNEKNEMLKNMEQQVDEILQEVLNNVAQPKAAATTKEINAPVPIQKIQVIDLKPGEVLLVTMSTDVDFSFIEILKKEFQKLFPNNHVVMMSIEPGSSIEFSKISARTAQKHECSCDCGDSCGCEEDLSYGERTYSEKGE